MLVLTVTLIARLSAQTLERQPDRFVVDGSPRFLLFISYFDAMRLAARQDAALDRDLAALAGRVDGIRIMVNWWKCAKPSACTAFSGDTLFDSRGAIRKAAWPRFLRVLDAAASHHLLVDVTFTRESIQPQPTPSEYAAAIREAIARLLRERPSATHVLFDVQNEYQNNKQPEMLIDQAVAAAHAANPHAIVTASQDQNVPPMQAGANAVAHHFDFVAYHHTRGAGWYGDAVIAGAIDSIRQGLAGALMPIALDEPLRWQQDPVAAHWIQAAKSAQMHGAAMFTFHTNSGYMLSSAMSDDPDVREQFDVLEKIRAAIGSTP